MTAYTLLRGLWLFVALVWLVAVVRRDALGGWPHAYIAMSHTFHSRSHAARRCASARRACAISGPDEMGTPK